MLAKIASQEYKKIKKGKSVYKHIYSNVPIQHCEMITVNDLCSYRVPNSLILLDEITLDVDSRDYKNFDKGLKEFITLHRHDCVDIVYVCQDWSRVDKTIRECTYDLWYIQRSVVPFFRNWAVAKCIFRNISINEYSSELSLGYRFADLKERLFSNVTKTIRLSKYTKYFNTYDLMQLADRPIFSSSEWNNNYLEKRKNKREIIKELNDNIE